MARPSRDEVLDLIVEVVKGDWDEHLETLLSALHDRKRAKRGRRTYAGMVGDRIVDTGRRDR